jgi:hypothetical protein
MCMAYFWNNVRQVGSVKHDSKLLLVLNATFNNVSVGQFFGAGNRSTWRKPLTCRMSLTNFITKCCIVHTSPWKGFILTTLVVIGTDWTGSCKSNYHTITRSPKILLKVALFSHDSSSILNIYVDIDYSTFYCFVYIQIISFLFFFSD